MNIESCGSCVHTRKVQEGRRCFDAEPCAERPATWPWLRPFDICEHYAKKEDQATLVRGARPE